MDSQVQSATRRVFLEIHYRFLLGTADHHDSRIRGHCIGQGRGKDPGYHLDDFRCRILLNHDKQHVRTSTKLEPS